ncbi:cytochrome P450 4C1-like [Diorhabda sublineata]|uniref:cytochrome P450 4C1-like n=1 Tax=Diorhabda sublineata TaxID=1163346 RepID=UPI0024E13439|nr:cytochrome P450 4C1-like [Diorhabda sublineata]
MDLFLTLLSVLITAVVIFISNVALKHYRVIQRVNKIPGPTRLPLVGNLVEILKCDSVQLFEKFREWCRKYGSVYSFVVLGVPVVVISGPEEFEIISSGTKHLQKGLNYGLIEPWLGKGLLTSSGEQWQQRRKILTPAFHFTILQEFIKVFNKETEALVNTLKTSTKPVNIVPLISHSTLAIIAETSFGTKLDMENKADKSYVSAIHEMGQLLVYRIIRPWLHKSILFNLLSFKSVQYSNTIDILKNFTNRIIAKRERHFETFEVNRNDDVSKRKKLAFLDILLNAKITKNLIDDEGIKDEVNTFMFEGHDTTATAISWILRQLTIYSQYQDILYQEIIEVLGEDGKQPELQDLNELKILERFIKETLRLYPSVPVISRFLDEDVVLNGYTVPKEASIDIWIYDIHRNPKYWTDPEKFDPDRFLPENCVNRHPFAYVPFSAGPRNCIGQKFAMLEIKAVLCQILRNFTLEAANKDDKVDILTDMVLRPANQINLIFTQRKNE